MAPKFLVRIQKKHTLMMRFKREKDEFARLFAENIPDEDDTGDRCWICSGSLHLVSIKHVDHSSTCTCKVHMECLQMWQKMHETKSVRIRVCPACRTKRDEWQPKRTTNMCTSHVGDGFCKRPMGHLGNCCI